MRAKKFTLLTLSLVMSFALVEIVLRVFWTNPYADTGPDRILTLRLNHHNLDLAIDRSQLDESNPLVSFRTDSRSYLRPGRRFDNPDYTVAFLGGSTTACTIVKEELRFPALVSKLLEDRGEKLNILNAARSGGTLHDSVNVLLNHVVQDRPDVAVVMHAVNDTAVIAADNYGSRMGQEASLTTAAKYTAQLASVHSSVAGLIRRTASVSRHSLDADQYIDRPPTVDAEPFRARLRIFVDVCRAFEIEPVLLTQPFSPMIENDLTPHWTNPTAQTAFNEVTREVARTEGAHLIDLERRITETATTKEEVRKVFYDGIHFTDYGSRVIAEHIAGRLYEILK